MNATPYLHLLWKEYRAIRAFWLSLVVLVLGALWLTVALASDAAFSLKLVYSLALGAPAFFALGAAGTSFALEQEDGTYDYLRAAPVSPRQVLTSKLVLTVFATVVMFAVLVPIAWQISGRRLPDEQVLHGILGLWLLAAIEAIAWGAFFSLLTARPLTAICLALVALSTTVHLFAWTVGVKLTTAYDLAPYLAAAPRRAVLAGLLLAVDVFIGLRWLNEVEAATRSSWKSWHLPRLRQPSMDDTETDEAIATLELIDAPDRGAIRGRLFWQHWRQSGRLMLLMGGLQIVLTFMALHGGFQDEWQYALVAMAMMAALAGGCVFLPDQERRNYRFFVEHNVPPRTVWWTRQLPWMATLAFSTLVVICLIWLGLSRLVPNPYSVTFWSRANLSAPYVLPPIVLGVPFAAVSYAAGQWTSMFVRSGLLAGFFGLLLAGVLCAWVYTTGELGIPWGSSVLPIPVVLLAATWLRAPDWIAENTRWRARLRAAAFVLVPAAAIFAAAINNRVNQVWDEPLNFNLAQYEAGMNEASRETADIYRRAYDLYVSPENSRFDDAWFQANAETLALVEEASRRGSCTLDDPRKSSDDLAGRDCYSLLNLLFRSARELEKEGKLDEALDRYFEALHVISHWQQHRASQSGTSQGMYVPQVFAQLVAWSTRPGQTPQQIKGAIDRLAAIDDSILHLDDGLKSNYILVERALAGGSTELAALIGKHPDLTQYLLRLRLPWEKTRENRLLRVSTNGTLRSLEWMRESLWSGNSVAGDLPTQVSWRHEYYGPWQALLSNFHWGIQANVELVQFEMQRRATLLLLALEAYRLEHGKLPAQLSDLAGAYLSQVPLDPYSGRDFLYFPQGVPQPTNDADIRDLREAQNERRDAQGVRPGIARGQPGIWSTGQFVGTQPASRGPAALELDPRPAEVIVYIDRGYAEGVRLSLYQALGKGRWFAIPDPAK